MTPLGFGTAGIGNHLAALTDEAAALVLEAAWQSGIRYFDTAPHYGLGLAERRLGTFLATKPRESYAISTKVGRLLIETPQTAGDLDDEDFVVPASHRRVWDFTEDGVRRSLAESLDRLGLDHVEMLYLHDPERWNLDRALQTGLPALGRVRDEGLAGSVGVASMDTAALLAAARSGAVDSLMVAGRHTLVDQSAATEVLPACRERHIQVTAAAVFNGGLLAAAPTADSLFDYREAPPAILDKARRIASVCAAYDVPLRVAALQFPLLDAAVGRVVIGGVTPDQVRQNAEDLNRQIPAALWDALRNEGLVPG
jgi:D-threo-aldose 1-dehydrogenase